MTDIEILENEIQCIQRNDNGRQCDRDCAKCDLLLDTKEILRAYNHAIYLLMEEADGYLTIKR